MKKSKLEKAILDELAKVPIVSIACDKVGLSRQSFYRWIREDTVFKEKYERAISLGTESINDLAESKLISNIKEGKERSIEFWLKNNKNRYLNPREIDYLRKIMSLQNDKLYGEKITNNDENVVKWIVVNGRKH